MKKLVLIISILLVSISNVNAQDVLGNVSSEGTLRIYVYSNSNMGIYRYTEGVWEAQWYSGDDRGMKLHVGSMGSSSDLNYASGYWGNSASYWDNIDLNKLDDNNHIMTCTEDDEVEVKQIVYYPANSANIIYQYEITNLGSEKMFDLRLFVGGDTYVAGDDRGIGYWDDATNTIGITNTVSGNEVNMFLTSDQEPYSYYSDAAYDGSFVLKDLIRDNTTNPTLGNQVSSVLNDNGIALEWRKSSLEVGETWIINAQEYFNNKFVSDLSVTAPVGATISQCETKDFTFTVENISASTVSNISLAESIDLSTEDWTAIITDPTGTFSLDIGESIDVTVSIFAPCDATVGSVAQGIVSATSNGGLANDVAYITVEAPSCAASLTSAVNTDDQTICQNTAITDITYSTISATGIGNEGVDGVNGLPEGISATWSGDVITISGTAAESGTFNYSIPLTGGDCAGTSASGTITVSSTPPNADAGTDELICASDSLSLDGTSDNGTVLWTSDGDGTFDDDTADDPVYSPGSDDITAGSVLLTMTVTGTGQCTTATDTSTLTLTLNTIDAPFSNAGLDQTLCSVDTFTATAASNNGTILWTSTGTGSFVDDAIEDAQYVPSAQDIIDGTVTLNIATTSALNECNGSVYNDQVTITYNSADAPSANSGVDQTICHEDTLDLAATASGGTIQWVTSGTGNFNDANIEDPQYMPSAQDITDGAVILTLQVTSASNECNGSTDYSPLTLIINSTAAVTLNNDYTSAICQGAELNFDVTTNQDNYEYYINDSLLTGFNSSSMSYDDFDHEDTIFARVEFGNGCWTTSDSIVVSVNDTLDVTLTADNGNTFCSDDDIQFRAEPNGSNYNYDFLVNDVSAQSSTDSLFNTTLAQSVDVEVIVTNSNTCTSSDLISVNINANPDLVFTGTDEVCDGGEAIYNLVNNNGDVNATYYFIKEYTGTVDTVQTGILKDYTEDDVEENAIFWVTAEQNGCVDSSQKITISYITEIFASMVVEDPTCQGQNAEVSIEGDNGSLIGGDYTFYVNGTEAQAASADFTFSYLPDSTGTDTVHAFIESGSCEATISAITILVTDTPHTNLVNDAAANTICNGDCVVFTVNSDNSGTDTYSFLRNGITSISTATNFVQLCDLSTATNEFVSVNIQNTAGCSSTLNSAAITVNDTPTIALTNTPNDLILCSYDQFSLIDNGNGALLKIYYGTDSIIGIPGTTYDFNTLNSGITNFNVVSATGGCTSEVNFTVNVIPEPGAVLVLNGGLFCNGQEVIITEAVNADPPLGTTFSFTVNNQIVNSIDPDITITNNIMNYTNAVNNDIIGVVVDYNGCQSSDAITLAVETVSPTLDADDNDYSICIGDELGFTAGGGFEYIFLINGIPTSDFRQTSTDISFDYLTNNDIVSVMAYSTNNCSTEYSLPPIEVLEYDISTFAYPKDIVCAVDTTIPLLISGSVNGSWSISPSTNVIFDTQTGRIDLGNTNPNDYQITFQSTSDCPTNHVETITVLDALTVPDLGNDIVLCNRDVVNIEMVPITVGNYTWTTNNETVIIDSIGVIFANNLQLGENEIIINVSNGVCDNLFDTIIVNQQGVPLVLNAGSDVYCYSDTIFLNAIDHPIPNTGSWSSVSGNISFNNPNSGASLITGMSPNVSEQLVWAINDTFCQLQGTDTMLLMNKTENISISTPLDSTKIITPVDFEVDANLMNYWSWIVKEEDIIVNDEASFTHTFYEPGIYEITLQGVDKNGCPFKEELMYTIFDQGEIYVPSMFSPNNDGDNDEIGPYGFLNQYSDYSFTVYNRWGNIVFQSNEQHVNWNGKHQNTGNDLPMDGYSWMMLYNDEGGNPQVNKGFFILIR